MNILIVGGTRHMGHYLTLRLREAGHRVDAAESRHLAG